MSDLESLADDLTPERDDWLPANFADGAALARSYRESQRKITEQAEELKALRAQAEQAHYEPEPFEPEPFQGDELEPDWSEVQTPARQLSPAEQMALASQVVAAQSPAPPVNPAVGSFGAAETELRAAHPDFPDFMDEIASSLGSRPDLVTQGSVSPAAASMVLGRLYNDAKLARSLEAMKINAQSAQGADGRPLPVDAATERWEQIQNAPLRSYEEIARSINRA